MFGVLFSTQQQTKKKTRAKMVCYCSNFYVSFIIPPYVSRSISAICIASIRIHTTTTPRVIYKSSTKQRGKKDDARTRTKYCRAPSTAKTKYTDSGIDVSSARYAFFLLLFFTSSLYIWISYVSLSSQVA